jgi:hypothetical protein
VAGRKPIAILIDYSSAEGTLFDASVAALAAHPVLAELLLRSLPRRTIQYRFMLTGMADAFVTDFTDVNRIREQRIKLP